MDADRWERRRQRWEERSERRRQRWDERQNRFQHPSRHLFSGVLFVAVGLIFLLGNLGYVDSGAIFRFWPVILIAAGVVKLAEYPDGYRSGSGIFWIVIGGLFLISSLNLWRNVTRDIWPVILIGIGAAMLWRTSMLKREREELGREAPPQAQTDSRSEAQGDAQRKEPPSSSNSILSATAILGGVARRNNSQDFRGGDATAIMGGCQIDLRGANITAPHEPVLEVFAMWGGIEIKVPPEWTVISRVDPILGGFDDKTVAPKDESKRFVVRGSVVMGGIEVKN